MEKHLLQLLAGHCDSLRVLDIDNKYDPLGALIIERPKRAVPPISR